jgi:hypothetical protein
MFLVFRFMVARQRALTRSLLCMREERRSRRVDVVGCEETEQPLLRLGSLLNGVNCSSGLDMSAFGRIQYHDYTFPCHEVDSRIVSQNYEPPHPVILGISLMQSSSTCTARRDIGM